MHKISLLFGPLFLTVTYETSYFKSPSLLGGVMQFIIIIIILSTKPPINYLTLCRSILSYQNIDFPSRYVIWEQSGMTLAGISVGITKLEQTSTL